MFCPGVWCGQTDAVIKFIFLLTSLSLVVACDTSIEHFRPNELRGVTLAASRRVDSVGDAPADAAAVTQSWFGTPSDPRWPADDLAGPSAGSLVDVERLSRAAGPVSSDRDGTHRGLYREHCVVCHGLEGQGSGPAALFQNPYPRNLRHGVFKWKSTERDSKPLREDLLKSLHAGLPGSSMPSFAAVDADDLDALVDYVIYLSVRGEVEREMIAAAVDELTYGDDELPDAFRLADKPGTDGGEVAIEVLRDVMQQWSAATDEVVVVPDFTPLAGESLDESVQRGRALFNGQIAACAGCHGNNANGEALILDYDDWTKEYSSAIGIDPKDRAAIRPLKKLGAMTPRLADPRNLHDGVFRGGGSPTDLYRRVSQGIAGSPMPGLLVSEDASGVGLTVDQVWDLVRYVQHVGGVGQDGLPVSGGDVVDSGEDLVEATER